LKTAFALAAAIGYAIWNLVARLGPEPEFDAKHTYLPFARKLLEDAGAFLASEQSLWVAPFSYGYPALFGADPMRIKVANIVLFVLLILIVFRIGVLLHSRRAGLAAAVLLAASPAIKIFIPTALTEPPFIFLTGVWIWALCEGHERRRMAWWIVAGLALGLALLLRPTYLYFAPVVLAAGFVAWWSRRVPEPEAARGIAIAHALALFIAFLVIARNAILFGFPSISTGVGAGLFLGSNPMTDGYDAGYLGLLLDDGAATGGKPHLSIESDRLLRGIATLALADMPFADLAGMYFRKLCAFLFVTQAETQGWPEVLRAWRIALLVLAAYGWWHIRIPAMRWLLGAAFAYQVLVHVPALYTFRYSVSAIELLLTIMAAVGVAHALPRFGRLAALGLVGAAGIGVGVAFARYGEPPSPHVERAPYTQFWKAKLDPPLTATREQPAMIEVRDAPGLHPWDNSILDLLVSAKGDGAARCRGFTARYKRDGEADFKGAVYRRVDADGEAQRHSIGSRLPLELYAVGTLRIEADCDPGAALRIHGARIATGRFATFYRDRYLGQPTLPGIIDPLRP
jgi:hypothetical protein